MKKIILSSFLFFFISSFSYSQSLLPKCIGNDRSNFNNCYGEYTLFGGSKYIGEWKNGKKNGEGTNKFSDGKLIKEIWSDGTLVRSKEISVDNKDKEKK